MPKIEAALPLAVLVFLWACSAPRQGVTEAFEQRPPRTIRVFPPSGPAQGADLVEGWLRTGIRDRGYGLVTPADATLFTRIEHWDRQLQPRAGRAPERVALSAKLVEDGSGELLWSGAAVVRANDHEEDDEGGSGDWLDSVLDVAIGSLSSPIGTDFEQVAEEAVTCLLASLPKAPARPPPVTPP